MKTIILLTRPLSKITASLFLFLVAVFSIHAQTTITIAPTTPFVSNCIPFGNNTSYGFTGMIYRNIPAFSMNIGDKISFDLGALNSQDTRRNIYFSTANINPAPYAGVTQGVKALGWVQVVPDSQIPLNPMGNNVVGDFELTYTATSSFTFPGGGFLIGFGASPPGAYADTDCEQVGVITSTNDPSGYFYERFLYEVDQPLGILDVPEPNFIGALQGFRLDLTSKPPIAVCKNAGVNLDSTGVGTLSPSDVDGGSTAPEGLLSLTVHPDTFTCANVGKKNIVILTITDSLGKKDSCIALVKVARSKLIVAVSAKTYAGGYTISCQGLADGEATATVTGGCKKYQYNWSTTPIQTTATATGLSAGTYTVTVKDANGTVVSKSITLTEPPLLVANAGSNQTVYNGYAPFACAHLSGTGAGGVPAYSYSWSNGATTDTTTVCPAITTTYTLTLTDQNGCKASDEMKVCVVDVRCEKGGNEMQPGQGNKVLICHKPGISQKTLCIPAEDVPNHLAHGDLLGECGVDTTCNDGAEKSASMKVEEESTIDSEAEISVKIHPNPSSGYFYVTIESGQSETVSIDVISISGQNILQVSGKIQDGRIQIPIDLTTATNGVYALNIQAGSELIIRKVTINK